VCILRDGWVLPEIAACCCESSDKRSQLKERRCPLNQLRSHSEESENE